MRRGSASSGSIHSTTAVQQRHLSKAIDVKQQLYNRAEIILSNMNRIPGFHPYEELARMPDAALPDHLTYSLDVTPPGVDLDPVSVLRRLLRMGAPLTLLYNAVKRVLPVTPSKDQSYLEVLSVDDCVDIKKVKKSIYRVCEACANELGMRLDHDLFTISQIFHDGIPELLAPIHTIELLYARMGGLARIPDERSLSVINPDDQLARVVDELLSTERKYVGELELLLKYYDEMLVIGIPRDVAKRIVPCIQRLVEFQQRFLVGCEHQFHLFLNNPQKQNFGWLFINQIKNFEVYKEYTLAQKDAVQTATNEINALQPLSHIIEPTQGLPMLLLTPVQRIMRYPLLLKSILKHTPENWPNHQNLANALDAMREMMSDVNETQRRAENRYVTKELQERVRDWRGLELSALGELLLSGVFPVTNASHGSGEEQEYFLYCFENALLCCRDRVQTTKKSALTKMRPSASSISSRNSQGRSLSLEIRGRVYMKYVSSVSYSKLQVGGYLLRLAWGHKNDASEHGAIEIRLHNEEQAQMWEQTIIKLSNTTPTLGYSPSSSSTNSVTTPTTAGSYRNSFRKSQANTSKRASSASINKMPSEELNFWDESPLQEGMRKMSVSSISSQHSETSKSSLQSSTPNRVNRQKSESSISVATGQRQIRIHMDTDSFIVMMPSDVNYETFLQRVERKLKLTGKLPQEVQNHRLKLEYLDEDDDRVRLESEEDLWMAFDSVSEREELSIHVKV